MVRKKIFLFLLILFSFSGCSKKEENNFVELEPDEYFVCNYEAGYQTEKDPMENKVVLLKNDGKVVEEFR